MIGGSTFILIQLVLIVDFAHNWADVWVGNLEETNSKGWFWALMSATAVQYILSLVGIIMLYVFYTESNDCTLNKFFISFNMILCIIVSFLSIMPSVQESQPRSGLLQSAIVTLYVVYLTWSAVANNPDHQCNPGFVGIISGDKTKVSFDKTSIVGLVIWMFCILYSSLRSANAASSISQPDPERQGMNKLNCTVSVILVMIYPCVLGTLKLAFFYTSVLFCLIKYSINNSYTFRR